MNYQLIIPFIKELSKDGGEFIVGMKLGSLSKEKKKDVYDLKKFQWIYRDELAVYEITYEVKDKAKREDVKKYRCIVTWSKKRFERDRKLRESFLEKIECKLSSKGVKANSFISNKGYKRYVDIPSKILRCSPKTEM